MATDNIQQLPPGKSIGRQLREARTALGWSIQTASKATKILPEQLVALEQDDYRSFAAPAYVRNFLRTYSRVLHLNEKALLEQLDQAFLPMRRGPFPAQKPLLLMGRGDAPPKRGRTTSQMVAFLVAAGLFALMCAVGAYRVYQVASYRRPLPSESKDITGLELSPEAGSSRKPEGAVIRKRPPLPPPPLEEMEVRRALPVQSPAATPSVAEPPIRVARAIPVHPDEASAPPPEQGRPSAVESGEETDANNDNDEPSTVDAGAPAASREADLPPPTKAYHLVLQARKESWIHVNVIEDGHRRQLFAGVLHTGERKEFVGPKFQIKVANSSVVDIVLDGQTVSMASNASPAQELTLPTPTP
ncbi:putative Predicted transcriptional regulator contains Xre-like HTH domain [Methylacidimicrobium sp. AP8]|uniref:helix-turn-helix domain-containing protein n=1 Tax=Methylacidimicrobium sp. AP8 TaxID=2730359 RepID=UPI0018BF9938|nr:helix-turn-helix domain-containing protein [Methylacidimicrobium sp. AP8]CAB4242680.1 putative Predicted transcriptional regulator contains Xre-like HTH domain [Methylacidimicrobium sp. AP8]